jgi:hypothetical protein
MKNNILKLIFFVSTFLFMGCEKEIPAVSKTVEESYPSITLNGAEVVVVAAGQTFTDPGATVSPGYSTTGELLPAGSTVTIPIKADAVELGTAEGIYFIPYTYRNYYGFESTISRKVVVVNQAYTSNYAGTWKRAATGGLQTWKNLGSGVHEIQNPGGVATSAANAALLADKLYVIIKNDNSVIAPVQTFPGSNATCSKLTGVSFTATQVKYALNCDGVYGTAVRTFDKQ